jgi:hypothetical protein
MSLIKVNSFTINPEKVSMLERKSGRRFVDGTGRMEDYSGISILFAGGGRAFIDEPEAAMIEAAFEDWDRDRPLPY